MKTKQLQAFPRSRTLARAEVQPDLVGAFQRWREAGELPATAILCVHVGSADGAREECYRNLETGALVNADDMETLSYLNVAKESPRKQYMVFCLPVDTANDDS